MEPARLMSVTVRGVIYANVNEAAKALGVRPVTIYSALSRGRVDNVGLGPGKRPRENRKGGNPIPITIGGITYPTRAAASRALGLSAGYVTDTVNRKNDRAKQNLLARAMAITAKAENESLRAILRSQQ